MNEKRKKMIEKRIDKLLTLTIEELDAYGVFIDSIYYNGITGEEIDAKCAEYLGIEVE